MDAVKKYLPSFTIKTVITSEESINSLINEFSGAGEAMVADAVHRRASDIHIEPGENSLR